MSNRTTLFDWHVANGARIVDFAGWDMPIQYSTIIEEHTAVRSAAGLFDISHMGRLSFSGPDSLALLEQVFTNSVASMKDFQVRYGLICNDKGGILDDVLVYRWPYGYAMVVNASNRAKIVPWLGAHKAARNVQISDQTSDTCMIAVQGPRAIALCEGLTPVQLSSLRYYFAASTLYQNKSCVVSRTGYTGEDGVEFIVGASQGVELWQELIRRGAKPCGLGARDTLRLEAAMPLYGHELSEDIDPLQAGLSWAVKLQKGEFIGRDALNQRQNDAARLRRIGLELDGKRIAREGATVYRGEHEVGRVSSGTFAPTVGKAIAMAYVDPSCTSVGQLLDIDIRGKRAPAHVVGLPFYQRAKS